MCDGRFLLQMVIHFDLTTSETDDDLSVSYVV